MMPLLVVVDAIIQTRNHAPETVIVNGLATGLEEEQRLILVKEDKHYSKFIPASLH
jgi:hypothetical protein